MQMIPALVPLLAQLALGGVAPLSNNRDALPRAFLDLGSPGNTFDYVIVGGGLAGLTLASRLSEDSETTVAVIEAGGFYEELVGNVSQIPADDVRWTSKSTSDVNPLIDWGFSTTPQAGALDQVIHYARGKALGGSTARNYMAYNRGTVGSYQRWADEVGDQSYTFNNILPYFKKSLNFTPPDIGKRGANATPQYDAPTLSQAGPLDITYSNYAQASSTWVQKGMQAIGILPQNGFTSGSLNGSSWVIATINHTLGIRESSETAFLLPALNRPNLRIYNGTLAKRVLFRGKVATGVQVRENDRQFSILARKEVIVSGGAFQSPQLLMVSGVGPAAILGKFNIKVVADRPGVGQNMWDHVLFGPSYRLNVQTASALAMGDNLALAEQEFIEQQDGLLASPGGDLLAYEKVPLALRQDFSRQALQDLGTFPSDWPEISYFSVGAFFGTQEDYSTGAPKDGYQYSTLAAALVAPVSRGNVSISSVDTADQPVINPNWLTSEADQQVAVAGYKRVRQIFASPVMQQNVVIGPEYFPGMNVSTDSEILQLIKQSFNTLGHATSTCKMGRENDTGAVVDSRGRVFGVQNLRVVDASSLPLLPPGLPMASICKEARLLPILR
ncbi:MAG: hypothetical protein LQ343_005533 [Gyalolechia ehrenbergii]|nr:MAG: hypothetical protein LQ343_005533 [Gyalolechia ehrenbergii]